MRSCNYLIMLSFLRRAGRVLRGGTRRANYASRCSCPAEPNGPEKSLLAEKKPLHGTHLRSRREAFEVFDPPPGAFLRDDRENLQLTSRLLEPLLLGVAAIPM
jgi:hypothetical protein